MNGVETNAILPLFDPSFPKLEPIAQPSIIYMYIETRLEKSSKPSAETFLRNSIFPQIESLKFASQSDLLFKIPLKEFKCEFE